jgi:putative sigma-54 modulation protein
MDKLMRRAKKYHDKMHGKTRKGHDKPVPEPDPAQDLAPVSVQAALAAELAGETVHAGDNGRVVKTKQFALKPMSVDEAALQMELVGHDFFVFTNAESNRTNVVYRRNDGHYGLIEPAEN